MRKNLSYKQKKKRGGKHKKFLEVVKRMKSLQEGKTKNKKNFSYKKRNHKKYKGGLNQISKMTGEKGLMGKDGKMNIGDVMEQGKDDLGKAMEQGKGVMKQGQGLVGQDGKVNMGELMKQGQGLVGQDGTNAKNPMNSFKSIKSSLKSLAKPPIMHLMDYMLYTLYTIAGIFIYYPTFLVNLPDTTLENIIPTEEGCKTLIGDELMCKRKLKCFFKKCSMFEDPIGYRIQKTLDKAKSKGKKNVKSKKKQKITMSGGKQITQKKKMSNYLKHVPKKIIQKMKQLQKKDMKSFQRLIASLRKPQRKKKTQLVTLNSKKYLRGGTSALSTIGDIATDQLIKNTGMNRSIINATKNAGTRMANEFMRDKRANIDENTCINKVKNEDGTTTTNHILCNRNTPIDYKTDEPNKNVLYKGLFGRNETERLLETTIQSNKTLKTMLSTAKSLHTPGSEEDEIKGGVQSFVEPEVVEEFLKKNLDNDSVFKLLICYKMLETIFEGTVSDEEMNQYNEDLPDEMYGVNVAFPWSTKNYFVTPEERRKCLFTHLTRSNLGDDYQSEDLYEKCFVCKNCTLANTSFKVWEKVFDNLFTSGKKEFSSISSDLYEVMKKHYRFQLMPIKQYYLIGLLSLYFIHPMMNLEKIDIDIQSSRGITYSLKDFILGIPHMSTIMEPSPLVKKQLQETYLIMKMLNIKNALYSMTFKMMYRNILKEQDTHIEKRLHEIKKQLYDKYKMFYGKQKLYGFLENTVNFNELEQFNPIATSETLNTMSENMEQYGDAEIHEAINEHLKSYIPLYEMLLNDENYDNTTLYENNENEKIKSFFPIIQKLNEIERLEKEKINQ